MHWNEYVIKTTTNQDIEYNTESFAAAGFPGCISSVDGTHLLFANHVKIVHKTSIKDARSINPLAIIM